MPRITDDTQPPLRSRPSIPRTWSSDWFPMTEARLLTLARGIRAVIFSRRRCSSFSGCCRDAIAIPPVSMDPSLAPLLDGSPAALKRGYPYIRY